MSESGSGRVAEVVVALAILAGAVAVGYLFNIIVAAAIIVVIGGLWIGWVLQRRRRPRPDEAPESDEQ